MRPGTARRLDVDLDQQRWRETRRFLNQNRSPLTEAAAQLYPDAMRVAGTLLLSTRDWLPDKPLSLGDVRLKWNPSSSAAPVTGGESESEGVRPLRSPCQRFQSYADAVATLDHPRLFEDRPSYRLLGVDLSSGASMTFGHGSYFGVINVSEAVAHEFAQHAIGGGVPTMEGLPFRSLVGDPFDLGRRSLTVAVSALTLRRDPMSGSASFVLHWRDPQRVASGGGLYQVMPVGMFQPISASPRDERQDFDLWRGLVREYSEEFLGSPERDGGDGRYEDWPFFRAMDQARQSGAIRVYCLGLGIDPLTLVADILMVAVFDADAYDDLIGESVSASEEGAVVTAGGKGFSFNRDNIYMTERPMQPAGAAALALSWYHRRLILND